MTKVFEDIKLQWDDKEYVIESDRVMGAIARIEQHITLQELYSDASVGKTKLSVMAAAYGSVLRYAGAKVADEDVYRGIFTGDSQKVIRAAIECLINMMIPPNMKKTDGGEENSGELTNRRARRAAASSSRKRTRQPARGDSHQNSSGDSTQSSSGGKQNSGGSARPTVQ